MTLTLAYVLELMRKIFLFFIGIALSSLVVAQDEIMLAELLTTEHQYQEAVDGLQSYILNHQDRRFDLARAWCLLSYNHMRLGYLVQAREANETSLSMRRALRVQELGENFLRAAQIALKQDDILAAQAYTEQGVQMLIEDTELLVELYLVAARVQAAQQQWPEMLQHIETALAIIEIELEDCQARLDRYYLTTARLYLLAKQYKEAAYWYKQTLECSDDTLRKSEALLYHKLSLRLQASVK